MNNKMMVYFFKIWDVTLSAGIGEKKGLWEGLHAGGFESKGCIVQARGSRQYKVRGGSI